MMNPLRIRYSGGWNGSSPLSQRNQPSKRNQRGRLVRRGNIRKWEVEDLGESRTQGHGGDRVSEYGRGRILNARSFTILLLKDSTSLCAEPPEWAAIHFCRTQL